MCVCVCVFFNRLKLVTSMEIHNLFFPLYFILVLFEYEELHSLYRSPNIVWVINYRRLRWAGHVARMEKGRSAFNILIDTPTGKRPLGRPRSRWAVDSRIDLRHTGINTGLIRLRIGIIG